MLVALTGRGVGGRARHGGGAGRDDHGRGRVRLALGDGAVDGFAVIGSCTLMLLFLCAVVEAQAVSPAGPEVAEANDGRLGIGE